MSEEKKGDAPRADAVVQIETDNGNRKASPTVPKIDVTRNMFFAHFAALLQKRVRYFLRDSKSIVFQLVIPAVAIILGMILLTGATFESPDKLTLTYDVAGVVWWIAMWCRGGGSDPEALSVSTACWSLHQVHASQQRRPEAARAVHQC